MRKNRSGEALDVFGNDEVAAADHRQRLTGLEVRQRPARGDAEGYFGVIARDVNDVHQVVDERLVDVNRAHVLLQVFNFLRIENGLEMFECFLRATGTQQLFLIDTVRVSDRQLHQKSIELRFGQRKRSDVFDRILRRDHQKRLRQRQAALLDADHSFAHRFEQRGLRLRRRAIDLIGEKYVGENRAGDEFEFLLVLVVNRHADDIRRKKIARELDALKRKRQ